MNKRLILRLLGVILLIEAAAMLPSLAIAMHYRDGDAKALAAGILLTAIFGLMLRLFARPAHTELKARDGLAVASISWIFMSIFGALPFTLNGMIPNYVDAIFETVSGFTTTGATILTDFDGLPRGLMFWRSFTHWIGGMGVLVLTLAILPKMSRNTAHLMRAESPGPTLSKLAPKIGDSAKILYGIYLLLTVLEWIILMIAGLSPYDAAIHAMGTAGTGGFSNYGASVSAFNSPAVEWIITIFMFMFGMNFALYFYLLKRNWKSFLRNEEFHWYLGIVIFSIAAVTLMLHDTYANLGTALRYASFQVVSVLSTTGFMTADFNVWPERIRILLLVLMFIGSCAGSTAGGMKVVRIAELFKQFKREIRQTFQPNKVQTVRFEGEGLDESALAHVSVFAFTYVFLALIGGILVSLDGRYDLVTNLSASITCISNVGPGLGAVGPTGNFAGYSAFSKIILSILMLCGRLEIYPMLVLLHPALWRKG